MSDPQAIYAGLFSGKAEERKNSLGIEICRYLRKFILENTETVVDVAAGYCDFINNTGEGKRKFAFDLNPDVQEYAGTGVTAVVAVLYEQLSRVYFRVYFKEKDGVPVEGSEQNVESGLM